MKTRIFLSASRLAIMTLASVFVLGFTACSSDDDEPSVDELLSDKTTPVTFELKAGYYHLFDYAGNRYVGSDTIEEYHGRPADIYRTEVDLRQGKHHLIWFTGLDGFSFDNNINTRFIPDTKVIESDNGQNIMYAECDVNVTEYLLPAQKLTFQPVTAQIKIEIGDSSPLAEADLKGLPLWQGKTISIGKIVGIPSVISTGLYDNNYTKTDNTLEVPITAYSIYVKGETIGTMTTYNKVTEVSVKQPIRILCPKDGLNDIQLAAEVTGNDGNPVPTSDFPKISLRRGYTTVLRGLLFDTSGLYWEVTMEPYE